MCTDKSSASAYFIPRLSTPFDPNRPGIIGNYIIGLPNGDVPYLTNNRSKRKPVRDDQYRAVWMQAGDIIQRRVDAPGNFSNRFTTGRANSGRIDRAPFP